MLALIAGTGLLPAVLVDRMTEAGQPFRVCALRDDVPDLPADIPVTVFRLEQLGSLMAQIRQAGCTAVCLAGAIRRPRIDPAQVDAATRPLLEQIAGALRAGDDGALRVVLRLFETQGFVIRAATDICPDLLPPAGVPTRRKPDDADGADAGRAAGVLAAMGRADLGQSCVVGGGQVLAVEALPGTDWMLDSLARLPSPRMPAPGPEGFGLFFKAPKPGQDRRADLPVVGPDTVAACARAGLRGLVMEEGGVILLRPDVARREADAAGLFLWVRRAEGAP